MNKIELTVADIHSASQPAEAFSLILKEKEGNRYVPVIIGMSEARAILIELNQSPTHRPLTHELFVSLTQQFNCNLVEVNIVHYENGVYFADMLLSTIQQELIHIDARPSDAIALALKMDAPFFMNADIFEQNCQEEDPVEEEAETNFLDLLTQSDDSNTDTFIHQKLSEMSTPELEELLQGAIESEDYELASQIQEELNQRKA